MNMGLVCVGVDVIYKGRDGCGSGDKCDGNISHIHTHTHPHIHTHTRLLPWQHNHHHQPLPRSQSRVGWLGEMAGRQTSSPSVSQSVSQSGIVHSIIFKVGSK